MGRFRRGTELANARSVSKANLKLTVRGGRVSDKDGRVADAHGDFDDIPGPRREPGIDPPKEHTRTPASFVHSVPGSSLRERNQAEEEGQDDRTEPEE